MSHRPQQVAREIMRALSQIIQEEFPLEQYGLITVTEVEMDKGYERARAYISTLNKGAGIVGTLNHRAGRLMKQVARQIKLRRVPLLVFNYDKRSDRVETLERLLDDEKDEESSQKQ